MRRECMAEINCKQLIYSPKYSAAITPVQPNYLIRWDVSTDPEQLSQQALKLTWPGYSNPMPIVALPGGERLAVAHWSETEIYIDVLDWKTGKCQQQLVLQPQAYKEIGMDDERCGHSACSKVSTLTIAACDRYLVVTEIWGDLQFIDLQVLNGQNECESDFPAQIRPETTRLIRRWTDYSGLVVIDPQCRFVIVESTDQFNQFDWYRIDNLAADQLTYLGCFMGDVRCHEDRFDLSVCGNYLIHSYYHGTHKATVCCYRLEPSVWLTMRANEAEYGRLLPTLAEKRWELSLGYIDYPHPEQDSWRSDVAFIDAETVLYGAGQRLARIDLASGKTLNEYEVNSRVQALAVEAEQGAVIVATSSGLQRVML